MKDNNGRDVDFIDLKDGKEMPQKGGRGGTKRFAVLGLIIGLVVGFAAGTHFRWPEALDEVASQSNVILADNFVNEALGEVFSQL